MMMIGIGTVTNAIFLHSCSIVDGMQDILFRKERQTSEYRRVICSDHLLNNVLQRECLAMHALVDGFKYQQSY